MMGWWWFSMTTWSPASSRMSDPLIFLRVYLFIFGTKSDHPHGDNVCAAVDCAQCLPKAENRACPSRHRGLIQQLESARNLCGRVDAFFDLDGVQLTVALYWITAARKLCLKFLSHFLQSSLYFFLPRSSRKNAHSLLRYFGIRGIGATSFSLPNCRFAPETQKRPKPDPAVWFRGDFGRFLSI